jgi:hypothetical protein
MASTDGTTSGVQRTAVKTRRIAPGVYRTLDGSHETARNDEGRWLLFTVKGGQRGEQIGDEYKTSDLALTALVDVLEADLTTLNTAPAKPTRNAEAKGATGRNESTAKPKGRQRKAAATA